MFYLVIFLSLSQQIINMAPNKRNLIPKSMMYKCVTRLKLFCKITWSINTMCKTMKVLCHLIYQPDISPGHSMHHMYITAVDNWHVWMYNVRRHTSICSVRICSRIKWIFWQYKNYNNYTYWHRGEVLMTLSRNTQIVHLAEWHRFTIKIFI